MKYAGTAYRGHTPKWAFAPTSGEGAAVHGGRFNPKGVPALYLSTSPEGAFREATRGFAYKFDPLTLVTYDIDCDGILDLRTEEARRTAGVAMSTMSSPWAWQMSEGKRPESWGVHDRFHPDHAGILVPSFALWASVEMTNLVLWRWSDHLPYQVRVHDPDGRLPHDQSSWRAPN